MERYVDFDHYCGKHARVSPAIHAHLRAQAGMSRVAIQRADRAYAEDVRAYYAERDRLRVLWEAGLADGSIQVMGRRERLERAAAGHPDNPSVQAARRLLAAMESNHAGA